VSENLTDYYMLNPRYWIIGYTTGFDLYYYTTTDKTLTIRLRDGNGDIEKDDAGNNIELSYNAVAGINDINLADWLSAANKSSWNEGTYLLEITDGTTTFYATFLILNGAVTLTVDEPDKIEKIIVYDNVSTIMIELPKSSTEIPSSDRFRTLVYLHNDTTKMGRLIVYNGMDVEIDTKWVRYAIMEVTVKFNSLQDIASYLAKHGYVSNPHPDVVNAIGKLLNSDPQKVVNILGLYGVLPYMNSRILDYFIDTVNYEIKAKLLIRLGFGWNDLAEALKWALGVGVIVGSIAVGVSVTVGTFGLGTAIGIGLAAGGITFGLKLLSGNSSDNSNGQGSDISDLHNNVDNTGQKGKQNIQNQGNNALNDLDNLHNNGEITDNAYNILKQDIQNLVQASITAIDEVIDEAHKSIDEAYKRGKNDGRNEMIPWTLGAGLGGTIIGFIIGKR